MSIIAVIPARGGSKGLPNKNIKMFCDKPLLAWSIEQASHAQHISSVWVTSDSEEILEISESFGARTIKRPAEISGDDAGTESAWKHAIETIENLEGSIDFMVGVQCTSPLREAKDFDNGIDSLREQQLDSLFTSCKVRDNFIWGYNAEHELSSLNHDWRQRLLRQKIDESFVENGSFYIFKPFLIKQNGNRLGGKIGTYVMDGHKRMQIDSQEDFGLCEVIMRGYGLDLL